MSRRAFLGPLAIALALAVVACDDDTVALAYRPEVGAVYEYESRVESTARTDLPGRPSTTTHDEAVLQTRHEVLEREKGGGVRVRVMLSRPGTGTLTFVMRFDRAAQLTSVESVEGIPAQALGDLGLSEIFPAAAGAPPKRPLAPGERWHVNDTVMLPGSTEPARLAGVGRLTELGVIDGHDTATVRSRFTLPLDSTASSHSGTRSLDGEQTTELAATYDLADGAVRRIRAITTGQFSLTLAPPTGESGEPLHGTISVEVRSRTKRVT